MQNASLGGLATALAITLATAPAVADPVVLNPNFTVNDTASNNSFHNGTPFFVLNWTPNGYASNTNTDPGQFDNGTAGGQGTVGFLSGSGTSLSQVVQGFVVGQTYRVSVAANARSQPTTRPTFRIVAGDTQVYGPTVLASVDPLNTFRTAFTPIQSDSFVAANSFVTLTFANAAGSNADASTLLSAVSVSSAVPEPISLAILGVGLVGVGIARRRG